MDDLGGVLEQLRIIASDLDWVPSETAESEMKLKPLTYLLIDFENVKPSANEVAQIRGDEVRLWIFRGPHQNKFDADMVEAWQPLGDHVKFIQSH